MINIHHTNLNTTQTDRRIERKFFVQPENIGFAYALLRQFCKPDCNFPSEQINSLYFDTLDLKQHTRSLEGEFRKDKVRVRWYHTLDQYNEEVPIFIELKSREGFTGSKQRKMVSVPGQYLEQGHLYNGVVSKTDLIATLAGFNYYPDAPVYPIIEISYWRYRFIELQTGMRVSLDYNIRSTMINRIFGNGENQLKIAGAVIEVKGITMELPVTLRKMKLLDIDWSRFSKYSLCLDSHLADPGTIARLWPSGILFET
jgi:hypothetical protein